MMQQVTRFISTVENKVSHWIVESDTPLEVAERMCLQFLQQLGNIRAQQEAARSELGVKGETTKNLPLPENLSSNENSKVEEMPHVES